MKQIESGKVRLIFLIIYIGILFFANRIAFGTWVPASNENSLWFAAGVLSLLLSSFLVTPYFERPANHIASAVAAIVACWLAFDWSLFAGAEIFIAVAVMVYLLLVAVISAFALLLRSYSDGLYLRIANTAKELTDRFGNDRFLFSIVIIASVGLFHRGNSLEVFVILTVLIVLVLLRPEAHIVAFVSRIRSIWGSASIVGISCEIAGFDEPDIVLLRQQEKNVTFGEYLLIKDGVTKPQLCVALDHFGRDFGMLLRAKLLNLPKEAQSEIDILAKPIPVGYAATIIPEGKIKKRGLHPL